MELKDVMNAVMNGKVDDLEHMAREEREREWNENPLLQEQRRTNELLERIFDRLEIMDKGYR